MEGNRDRVESASVRHGREVAAWTAVSQGGRGGEKSYTARDWLASILVRQQNASVLDTLAYSYTDTVTGLSDPTGHLRQEVDAGSRVHAFHYDNLYELVQETHPDFGTLSYSYDQNGNRATRTSGLGTDYYGVDANNKLLWVNRGSNSAPTHLQTNPYTLFTYDACGRTTYREHQFDGGWHRDFSLTWDADDRLRSVKNGTDTWLSASYDGDGTRVSKSDFWTGAHNYSWGPGGVVHDSSGSGTVHTPGFAQRQGSIDRFYHDDWLGSTRYLSDSTGNAFPAALRFDAFGNRSASAGTDAFDPTEFQFAGSAGYETEYASGTEPGVGLQLLGQRYYDPVVGRFISQDPIGFAGGLNLYDYCGNDPVSHLDPSGLQAEEEPFKDPKQLRDEYDDIRVIQEAIERANEERFRELLQRAGVTPEQWDPARQLWERRLEDDIKSLPESLLRRYPWLRPRGGVYLLRDPGTGEVCRSGQTKDLGRRRGEHRRAPETQEYLNAAARFLQQTMPKGTGH